MKSPDVRGPKNVSSDPEVLFFSPWIFFAVAILSFRKFDGFVADIRRISDEISRCQGPKKCIIRSGSFVFFSMDFFCGSHSDSRACQL